MNYRYLMMRWICLTAIFAMPFTETNAQQEKQIEKVETVISRVADKVSGIVNMRYQYSDAGEGSNGFDIRRARLDVKGAIAPQLDYRIHAELANSPKILDAYVSWAVAGALNVKAGEFKIPFSLENPYSAYALEMIDNSMVITGLSGYSDVSGISANGRDIGVNVSGKFLPVRDRTLFEYSVGVFNGNGINVSDNNKAKDLSGTLIARPTKEITVSASQYYGTTGPQGETFRRIRSGIGARYDNKKLLARGEYIYGRTGDMNSDGFYIVAGYFVLPKLQTLLKYDRFRRDVSIRETQQTNYIVGVNYFPLKNFHFKLNYSFRTTVGSRDVNHVAVQFLAMF
jgi:hypothetical protein